MKVNELMVGDYLYSIIDRYDHVEKKICKVTGISTDGDSPLIQCDDTDVWYSIESYEPIPLTKEILEKYGFDVSDPEVAQYHFEDPSYLVDGKPERLHFSLRQMYNKDNKPQGYSFYAFNVLTIIDYIHQLQHALRLCGITKNIEI